MFLFCSIQLIALYNPNNLLYLVRMFVQLLEQPPSFISLKRKPFTAAQKRGLSYERKVHTFLAQQYSNYQASPWLQYVDRHQEHFAQPDGFLFLSPNKLLIIEIKLRHTKQALEQLYRYRRLARELYPQKTLGIVEITKIFDPDTYFPSPIKIISNLDEASFEVCNIHVLTVAAMAIGAAK